MLSLSDLDLQVKAFSIAFFIFRGFNFISHHNDLPVQYAVDLYFVAGKCGAG